MYINIMLSLFALIVHERLVLHMLLWVLIPIGVIETTVETVLSASRDPTDKLWRCPRNIAARLA